MSGIKFFQFNFLFIPSETAELEKFIKTITIYTLNDSFSKVQTKNLTQRKYKHYEFQQRKKKKHKLYNNGNYKKKMLKIICGYTFNLIIHFVRSCDFHF